eukprot:9181076-Pyramimonas_sp.AAC.2
MTQNAFQLGHSLSLRKRGHTDGFSVTIRASILPPCCLQLRSLRLPYGLPRGACDINWSVTLHADNMEVVRGASLGALKGNLLDLKRTLDGLVPVLKRHAQDFTWAHISCHQGAPWNEMADTLA